MSFSKEPSPRVFKRLLLKITLLRIIVPQKAKKKYAKMKGRVLREELCIESFCPHISKKNFQEICKFLRLYFFKKRHDFKFQNRIRRRKKDYSLNLFIAT